ncbi:MAG: DUF262 domain-containing protein [Chryseolinea sp.]
MKRQSSIHPISWFLDLNRTNQLDLHPAYQRRSVWSPRDRRFFLDTIFRNYPCPPLFLHRTIDDRGFSIYHVVDGKQRLETILMFSRNEIAIGTDFGDTRLAGKKFDQLEIEEKRKFWDYIFVIDFIEIDGTNVNEIFDRVNRNAINLERQELRHAKFNGWFSKQAEVEASEAFWETIKISTKARAKRMKDVQFISELLLVILDDEFVGFDQDYLDDKYAEYDDPEETVLDFDETGYMEKKEAVKAFLAEVENHNHSVTRFAKTFNNFYTLWSTIALNKTLPTADVFAEKYLNFMESVEKFAKAEDPEMLLAKNSSEQNKAHYNYYKNSRGASTDLYQRHERFNALSTMFEMGK